jgi:hypothetical protein
MKHILFCISMGAICIGCIVSAQTGNYKGNTNTRCFESNGNVVCTSLPTNSYKPDPAANFANGVVPQLPANFANVAMKPGSEPRVKYANPRLRYDVCGNPQARCDSDVRYWELYNLPILIRDETKMWDVFKSRPFYAIVLKLKKEIVSDHVDDDECLKGYFDDAELEQTQAYFLDKKVFADNDGCHPAQQVRYSTTLRGYNLLAVYAGKTMQDAAAMLRKVKATGMFPAAQIKQMTVELCAGCH